MIDRLDEIFPRRSDLERTALRGLLRSMRFFSSPSIRVKVFLRDDMLDQVVRGDEGFTALTHITARQADTLRWTEDQILSMVVKRIFANDDITTYFKINKERLDANAEYRSAAFYKVFPPTVHGGEKQSSTLRWIFTRCSDGRGVVTPRDVIDLLSRAKQKQQDEFSSNADGTSEWLIGPAALHYGLQQLSIKNGKLICRRSFLIFGRISRNSSVARRNTMRDALVELFHKDWKGIAEDLSSIGFFKKSTTRDGESVYWIPYLYRHGLELTQGKA